jgi:anaerobic selenocysteine-containing dehydrogenase
MRRAAVETRTGRIIARVETDASMRRGLVALPHGYGQQYPWMVSTAIGLPLGTRQSAT